MHKARESPLMFFLFLACCDVTSAQQSPPPTAGDTPVQVQTDESKRRMQIYSENRARLMNGDFDALEKAAQQLRISKETYFHGSWALTSFYLGVADINYNLPDQDCLTFLEKVKAWVAAKPQSVTARIALAHALTDYAWKARGTGWAGSVTDNGAKLMQDRLTRAQAVLDEARKLPQKCPAWWDTAQTVALGTGMDKASYMALVKEATAFAPTYIDYYSNAVLYLQPRWY
jgi:hypothetical protein